ncbi:uncharacterized protein LOC143277334 [Babylonia areolata]|uniref:uncharacterized protein LOC143277334 n=1 Tax=Babylonia areolata TaxID=304850 RepID=UPI003FD1BF5F
MTDDLDGHPGTINIGGRTITNFRFADIAELAGSEKKLAKLVDRLDETSIKYRMKISAEKTKLMTNSKDPIKTKNSVSSQQLETVRQFQYLGAIISGWVQGRNTELRCNSTGKTGAHMERRERPVSEQIRSYHMHWFYCLVHTRVLDSYSRTSEKGPNSGNEMPQETRWHLLQRPHNK